MSLLALFELERISAGTKRTVCRGPRLALGILLYLWMLCSCASSTQCIGSMFGRHQWRWSDGDEHDMRKGSAMYVNVCEQTIPSPNRPVSLRSVTHLPTCITDRCLPLPTQGVPEDLLFFYQSIRQGGGAFRVDQSLLVYRYHEKATTHSVSESVPSSLSFTLWWHFH